MKGGRGAEKHQGPKGYQSGSCGHVLGQTVAVSHSMVLGKKEDVTVHTILTTVAVCNDIWL